VYFTDHGAKGLVAFGESVLKATELNKAIKNMYDSKKYNKMVFYVEACESGSMFKNLLPKNLNVFATTASNATTSSFACYFDEARKTFLADVYSIKWMQDSDKNNIEKETLEQQYRVVKRETNTSTVCEFGDTSIGKMTVGTFQGQKPISSVSDESHPVPPNWKSCGASAVSGPEVPVTILQKSIELAQSEEEKNTARERLQSLLCHCWLSDDKMLVCCESGELLLFDTNGEFSSPVVVLEERYSYVLHSQSEESCQYKCINGCDVESV